MKAAIKVECYICGKVKEISMKEAVRFYNEGEIEDAIASGEPLVDGCADCAEEFGFCRVGP